MPAIRALEGALRLLYRLHLLRLRLTRPVTLGVRVVLARDGCVLLVRHTYQQGWGMPGGGVERGETLEQAARREAREETGAQLGEVRLLGVYTNFAEYKSDHVVVFTCQDFTLAEFRPSAEIAQAQFFPLDALPDDLFAGHRRRIAEYRQGAGSPGFGPW